MQAHLQRLEEAGRRDHRRLGQELGLFFFDPVAPASPFFLPRGAALTNALTTYVRGLYERYGYQEVITPQVFDSSLWKRSGHYDNYRENMYFTYADEQEFAIKPMELPRRRHPVRLAPPLLPRPADTLRRLRTPAPLRALRCDAWPHPRADVLPGRRAHLLRAGAGGERGPLVHQHGQRDVRRVRLRRRARCAVAAPGETHRHRRPVGHGGGRAGVSAGCARHGVRARSERGRVLRPEDRFLRCRRPRARVAAKHRAAGLQPAGALRPRVRRLGGREASSGGHPPRHAGQHRALPRSRHRALRRRVPGLASAGAGGGHPHRPTATSSTRSRCGRGWSRQASGPTWTLAASG